MDDVTRAAFERLLKIALGMSGQSKRVANFTLAWWNGQKLGGFDLSDLFSLDRTIGNDMVTVFAFLTRCDSAYYPEEYREEIEKLIDQWRPEIGAQADQAAS